MARRPYRIKMTDNPTNFGRITLPKGALLSAGPGDSVSGVLGAGSGTAPAYKPILHPYRGYAPQQPNFFQSLVGIDPNNPSPAAQGNAQMLRNFGVGISNLGKQFVGLQPAGQPIFPVTPATSDERLRRERGQSDYYSLPNKQLKPSGIVPASNTSTNSMRYFANADMSSTALTSMAEGVLPGAVSFSDAQASGNLEDLLALNYRQVGGFLLPPAGLLSDATADSGSSGGGDGGGGGIPKEVYDNPSLAGLTRRELRNIQRRQNWDELSYAEKKRRELKGAREESERINKLKQQKGAAQLKQFGLVNLNVSAG